MREQFLNDFSYFYKVSTKAKKEVLSKEYLLSEYEIESLVNAKKVINDLERYQRQDALFIEALKMQPYLASLILDFYRTNGEFKKKRMHIFAFEFLLREERIEDLEAFAKKEVLKIKKTKERTLTPEEKDRINQKYNRFEHDFKVNHYRIKKQKEIIIKDLDFKKKL